MNKEYKCEMCNWYGKCTGGQKGRGFGGNSAFGVGFPRYLPTISRHIVFMNLRLELHQSPAC